MFYLNGLFHRIFILVIFSSCHLINSEYFTAIVDIVKTVEKEKLILDEFSKYLNNEIDKMVKIKGLLSDIKERDYQIEKDENYFSNPINVYRELNDIVLDKKPRLQELVNFEDFDETGNLIENSNNMTTLSERFQEKISYIKSLIDDLPDYDDLKGSMDGLFRLQDVYKLNPNLLVKGEGLGLQKNSGLNAYQCFGLGYYAHLNQDFTNAVVWLTVALELQKKEVRDGKKATIDAVTVLDYLTHSLYRQGKVVAANTFNNELISLEPTNERAISNKLHFEETIRLEREPGRRRVGEDFDKYVETISEKDLFQMNYEKLCRGENLQNPLENPNLKCYLNFNIPMYMYAPLKEILLWDRPYIKMFIDIITDEEIDHIKNVATPRLRRATVQNSVTGEMETAEYRISKSTWLSDDFDEIIERVNKRISIITGLNLDLSEQLQIGNYGIGGQYEPHYDHSTDEERSFDDENGNRIATFMFYLSNVEAGGDTVFTEVNTRVSPRKNSAVFWWNLHRNGRSDDLTRHAACPVLVGSKWVMNKWIHDRGQEFTRPCGLADE